MKNHQSIPHQISRLGLTLGLAVSCLSCAHAQVTLVPLGTYATGVFDEGAQEIVTHDPATQRLFAVNANATTVDVINISDPSNPTLADTIDLTTLGGGLTSVAVANGILAVAVVNEVRTDPGLVAFYNASTLALLKTVQVGALPDMVTFTPDKSRVLTANEGEPSGDYTVDPEGSVSIVDISSGVENATVTTANFQAFNGLALPGIRIYGPGASVAQDLEPEYIAVSADSKTAWVTLQENNALAIVDIPSATVTQLVPLGFKDHSLPGNGLDASDRDDGINIAPWPVLGMYQPDGIAAYQAGGATYLVTANEGDVREYDAFEEEIRVADLKLDKQDIRPEDWKKLKKEDHLGRIKSTVAGGDTDGDGRNDAILTYGARSFSIWDASGRQVFDSGDDFEQVTALAYPDYFNASHDDNDLDSRSDDKGPEPEGLTIATVFGGTYAFIGLERISGIMIYEISDPANPSFQGFVNNRNFEADVESPEAGDLGPECVLFIASESSPNGEPLLVVSNEVSGTTTVYQVKKTN